MAEIKGFVLGVILFTFITVAGVSFLTAIDFQSHISPADKARVDSFNQTFMKMNELQGKVDELNNTISGKADSGTLGVLNSLILTSWNGIHQVFNTFGFFISMLWDINAIFPEIPSWPIQLGVMAIIVVIVFVVFSAIFQREM